MLDGETMGHGAPATCAKCGVAVTLQVYHTPAGYYVGTYCDCGPYSRESVYFDSEQEAQRVLNRWTQEEAMKWWRS